MSKFKRTDLSSRPPAATGRVYGEQVSMGEPVRLHGNEELQRDIENSLEMLAKQRLLEAEAEAQEKAEAILNEAQAQAAQALDKANAQAREMLETAQSQVDSIRDTAYEEGFKAGFQEGYTDATEQVERETVDLLKGAHTLAETAYQAERRILKDFEHHALQLIEHLVCKILQKELAESPESLAQMIDQAIEHLYLTGKVKVVVSSQVIQDLREFSAQTRDTADAMHRFEFVADPALELHQMYIIGQEGSFELTPEVQARQLMAPLKKSLTLPRPEPTPMPAPGTPEPDHAEAAPDPIDSAPSANAPLTPLPDPEEAAQPFQDILENPAEELRQPEPPAQPQAQPVEWPLLDMKNTDEPEGTQPGEPG